MLRRAVLSGTLAIAMAAGCATLPQPTSPPNPTDEAPSAATSTPPTLAAIPDAWTALLRPLQLPTLQPGEKCPATTSLKQVDGIGPLLGDGPIYPAFAGPDGVFSLGFADPAVEPVIIRGREWWSKKTLWVSDDTYHGVALVRGGRIDRDGEILFYPGSGPDYVEAMRLTEEPWVRGPSTPPGWREWNSGVFFAEPGCYAYQIDGEGFSSIVVVEATAD